MADSNITKRALANALKELMAEKSFAKINVADICEKCGMNRKSFYYHFKDKYDLVNWIFDTEFLALVYRQYTCVNWEMFAALCRYLYQNQGFYRKAFDIRGQNSFAEHFHELLHAAIQSSLYEQIDSEDIGDFQAGFFADAAVMAIRRWIMDKNCMPPEEFLNQLKLCIRCIHITDADPLPDKTESTP